MERVASEAWFETVNGGSRFFLLSRPPRSAPRRGAVLYVHPFAEEMNKCRRMAALGARALAAAGWTVLQVDLLGCGDSDGDFGEATWDVWRADLRYAASLLRQQAIGESWIWASRAGALLATTLLDSALPSNLLLWQPVVDGSQHLTHFLRLKVAAGLIGSGDGATTKALRSDLAAGHSIEVAGYTLSPDLASGLDSATLSLPAGFSGRVVWLEIKPDAPSELSFAAKQRVASWSSAGIDIHSEAIPGFQFWQTQEITECEALIERSVALLSMRPA